MGHRVAYNIGKLAGTVRQKFPDLLRDGIGLSGAASIAYGAWAIYAPAGFIVGGILLIVGAWLDGRSAGSE